MKNNVVSQTDFVPFQVPPKKTKQLVDVFDSRGVEQTTGVDKQKKVTKEQATLLSDLMLKLEWNFKPKPNDIQTFIEGNKLSDSVKKLLSQAHNSELKLSKEAMLLMKKMDEGSQIFKDLKKGYTAAQQHIQDLKHISDFKELPTASDTPMSQQSFNDAMTKVQPAIVVFFFLNMKYIEVPSSWGCFIRNQHII